MTIPDTDKRSVDEPPADEVSADEPSAESRAAELDRPAHPPLRLRGRTSILLPDLRPPTIEELRWRSQERRERKAIPAEPRPARVREPRPPRPARVAEPPPARVAARLAERRAQRRASRDLPLPTAPPPAPLQAAHPVRIESEAKIEVSPQWPVELEQWVGPVAPFDQVEPLEPAEPWAWTVAEPEPEPEPVAQAVPEGLPARFPAYEPLVAVPPRLDEPLAEPAAAEPLIEETDDLDGLDTGLDLDLDFRPVPPMLREPRLARSPDRWLAEPAVAITALPPTTPDIVAVFDEPSDDDSIADALATIELEPWRPDSPAPPEAPQPEAPRPVARPPLVSHVLVVREPVPFEPARVAVLDAPAETITRFVPLPSESIDKPLDQADEEPIYDAVVDPYPDERYEPPPAVPKEWHGRPAPLYWRLLRLRYVRPNGWLRALFFEGAVAVAVVLVLAEAASVWTIVVLPMVVAVIVKANDVVAGNLRQGDATKDLAAAPPD
jgi:hypothetical protein